MSHPCQIGLSLGCLHSLADQSVFWEPNIAGSETFFILTISMRSSLMGLPQVSILRLDIGIKSPANYQVANVFKFSITILRVRRVRGEVSSEFWGNQFWSSLFKREKKKNVSLYLKVYTNLVWVILKRFRPMRTISDKFEPFQTSLNNLLQVWTILDKYRQVWTSLDKFRQV